MQTELDLDGRYSVAGHGGVAFYLLGYDTEWTEERWTYLGEPEDYDPETYYDRTGYYFPDEDPANYVYNEPEEVERTDRVRAVMVGDDHVWTFDIEDLTPLHEGDYCPGCGQIGCKAYG